MPGHEDTGLKYCIYITALTECSIVQNHFITMCNTFIIFFYLPVCLMFYGHLRGVHISLK